MIGPWDWYDFNIKFSDGKTLDSATSYSEMGYAIDGALSAIAHSGEEFESADIYVVFEEDYVM